MIKYYTRKDIENIIGVSKTLVNDKIAKLGIKPDKEQKQKRFYNYDKTIEIIKAIDENFDISIIEKDIEISDQTPTASDQSDRKTDHISTKCDQIPTDTEQVDQKTDQPTTTKIIEDTISVLREQLTRKDEQISELNKRLSEANENLKKTQEQLSTALTAIDQQQKLTAAEKLIEAEQQPQEEKRGFFSRFKRKNRQ